MNFSNILVIAKDTPHLYRLVNGFRSIGVEVSLINSFNSYDGKNYDMTFIDPRLNESFVKINTDQLIFFDCQDDPNYFEFGNIYHEIKDKVNYYAKMVRVEDFTEDNKKIICYPIEQYIYCSFLANQAPEVQPNNKIYFNGAPTSLKLNLFDVDKPPNFNEYEGVSSIGFDGNEGWVYNQRIDWLADLDKNKISNFSKIVFSEKDYCYSLDYMTKLHGNVQKFAGPRIDYMTHLNNLLNYRISLCPTGHDRISFRVFDCMALGSLIISTDLKKRKMLYMPEIILEVPDNESLTNYLYSNDNQIKSLLKESRRNKEVLKQLNLETIKQKFINEL